MCIRDRPDGDDGRIAGVVVDKFEARINRGACIVFQHDDVIPVLALTATATPEVVKDIQARLHFREENVFCICLLYTSLQHAFGRSYRASSQFFSITYYTH